MVTALAFAVIAVAVRHLVAEDRPQAAEHHKFTLPANPLVYLVGLMALLTMISEGAVLDWAALYLRQELGADLAIAGLAYAAFSGVMAIMRFFGDGVRNRFGAVTTLRGSALVAAAGMLVAGLSPSPWLAIAAFALCGFGIANMVPIIFSAGGNQEGMSSGTGMSVVTTMGYSGISGGAVGDRLRCRAFQLRSDLHRHVGAADRRLADGRARSPRRIRRRAPAE